MKKILCLAFVLFVLSNQYAHAYWIWSPKTGKFENPKWRVFETPEEQFNWAKSYFDEGDYRKAVFEMNKVLRSYPSSRFAPEAKFYIAQCYEKKKKLFKAIETYQDVIKKYPLNERLEEIVEKEFLIGEKFLEQRKYELAQKIFRQVIQNAPYSKVSDVAQYKIGICLLSMGKYGESRDELEKLAEDYSFSPYIDDAYYHIGLCSFKLSSAVKDYDEDLVDQAVQDIDFFLRRFPTSEFVSRAESLLNKLEYKKAERLFVIAQFYEKHRKIFAAMRYYEELLDSYPKTEWGPLAKRHLERLQKL